MAKAIRADQQPVALLARILAISIEIGSELAFGHSRLAGPQFGDERPTRIAASELYARYEAWSGAQGMET